MVFVNEKESRRVIDYERGVYLERSPAPFGMTFKNLHASDLNGWNLFMNGQKMYFVVHRTLEPHSSDEGKYDITYTVIRAEIPAELEGEKIKIRQLIEEGLYTYGYYYGEKNISNQYFKVDPRIKTFE